MTYPHDAACRSSGARFHWADTPGAESAEHALDFCRRCPVVQECAQDAADTGERYRLQVRAGLRFWIDEELAQLPEPVVYEYEPPAKKRGRQWESNLLTLPSSPGGRTGRGRNVR